MQVERLDENNLRLRVWSFNIRGADVIFYAYMEILRISHDKEFERDWSCPFYSKYNERESNMDVKDIPFPDDVRKEAYKYVLDNLTVYSIQEWADKTTKKRGN